jgi:hypothetical protein
MLCILCTIHGAPDDEHVCVCVVLAETQLTGSRMVCVGVSASHWYQQPVENEQEYGCQQCQQCTYQSRAYVVYCSMQQSGVLPKLVSVT